MDDRNFWFSERKKTFEDMEFGCRTYVLWIAEVENDSDRKAGFRGRGRLVILRKEKNFVVKFFNPKKKKILRQQPNCLT